MAVSNSSLIGANFAATGSTQLFALGTNALGTDGTVFQYVEASATQTTGSLVSLTPRSTAFSFITAYAVLTQNAIDIGAFQGLISQGEFGWVAKQGRSLYVKATGTIAAGAAVGLSAGGGRLEIASAVAVNFTLFGIYVTTSASTGTASVAVATLTWPRVAASVGA